MKYQKLTIINCGKNTCASSPGIFCTNLRTQNFGTQWHCQLYDQELYAKPNDEGWLQRLDICRADFAVHKNKGSGLRKIK